MRTFFIYWIATHLRQRLRWARVIPDCDATLASLTGLPRSRCSLAMTKGMDKGSGKRIIVIYKSWNSITYLSLRGRMSERSGDSRPWQSSESNARSANCTVGNPVNICKLQFLWYNAHAKGIPAHGCKNPSKAVARHKTNSTLVGGPRYIWISGTIAFDSS